jgi:hypothetical protein
MNTATQSRSRSSISKAGVCSFLSLLVVVLLSAPQETCSFSLAPNHRSRSPVVPHQRSTCSSSSLTCSPNAQTLFAFQLPGRNAPTFLQAKAKSTGDDDDEDIDYNDDDSSTSSKADGNNDENDDEDDWGEPPDFDADAEPSQADLEDEESDESVDDSPKNSKTKVTASSTDDDDDEEEDNDNDKSSTAKKVDEEDEDDDDDDDPDIEFNVYDEEEDDEDDDDGITEEVDGQKTVVASTNDEYDDEDDEEEDWDEDDEDDEDDNLDDDWDEDEDGGDYPLEDDPDDPDYTRQKEIVEAAVAQGDQQVQDDSFDELDFVQNTMTPDQADDMDQLPFLKAVEERAKAMMITEEDVTAAGVTDLSKEVEDVSDIMDDPYPRHEEGETNTLQDDIGVTDNDMQDLDDAYKRARETAEKEPWDKVMSKDMTGWENLDNETFAEMEDCLDEIGGSAYNVSRWLLYDLDFNVSNLILSAVKHNRDAPILFQHWYPQLVTYKRYEHARERNFDFTWDDVENADSSELERYYAGFGYDEIPEKAPAETGIIGLEYLDEEEIKMAAFETWMTDVYNPEWDRKDFDDDTLRDEDNVFSKYYEAPQHPDLPAFEDAKSDIEEWGEDLGDDPDTDGYRDMMGQTFEYNIKDEEADRNFRGHLVVACTGEDSDLEIAEKITLRFKEDFGKQVFVETRVMALAREEDNVYEIWLESYDIELLHSRKRAMSNAKGWSGPAEIDDAQIDYLAKRVAFLISDDSRYSYTAEMEYVD